MLSLHMSAIWDLIHLACMLMLPVMVPMAVLLLIRTLRRIMKRKNLNPALSRTGLRIAPLPKETPVNAEPRVNNGGTQK
jgi:hypothetical protein